MGWTLLDAKGVSADGTVKVADLIVFLAAWERVSETAYLNLNAEGYDGLGKSALKYCRDDCQ